MMNAKWAAARAKAKREGTPSVRAVFIDHPQTRKSRSLAAPNPLQVRRSASLNVAKAKRGREIFLRSRFDGC